MAGAGTSPVRGGLRLGLLAVTAGCAGAASPAVPGMSGAGAYVREVAPFEVLDENGVAYPFPFLGGFNVPRPQFVDIDADGDLDLFIQERSNDLMFFENTGSRTAPRFEWRTDRYGDLDIGEWFRFVDLDQDGDADLLAEQPFSLIRYYRNEGGRFTLAADTLRDTAGEAIYSDRQNIPNATDIDCDDHPDLFLGRLTGTITRYEGTAPAGARLPAFELVTDRFEDIEIVATFGSMHGANSMVFADVDGDGDEDLFWGDFFEPGVLFIPNTGTCATPSLRGEPIAFPENDPVLTSGFNVPAVADPDGDGDFDLLIGVLGGAYNPNRTAADNLYYLENTGGAHVLRTRRFLGQIDVGAESAIALGDIDGDGDIDMLVAAKLDPAALTTSRILVFENTGSAARPAFRLADTLDIAGSYHYAPEIADLDGDGDADLLLGTWNDGVKVAWNVGTARAPRWELADSPLVRLTRGSHTVPAVADFDGDGDLDLFVGEASGALNYYRNDGTARAPRFVLVSDEYGGFDAGRRSAPAAVDLDGDGWVDLVVGSEDGTLLCLSNSRGSFRETPCPMGSLLPNATPRFADIDGDGDVELLTGTLHGGVAFYRRR